MENSRRSFEWWVRSGVMQGQITMFEDDENAEK